MFEVLDPTLLVLLLYTSVGRELQSLLEMSTNEMHLAKLAKTLAKILQSLLFQCSVQEKEKPNQAHEVGIVVSHSNYSIFYFSAKIQPEIVRAIL